MKKFKNLKLVAVICLFMVFSGCSSDASLDIIEEANIEEQNLNTKSEISCDLRVKVTYMFDAGMTVNERKEFITSFRLHMSQYFAICSIVKDDTNPDIEYWMVNGPKFDVAVPWLQGTGAINSSGNPVFKPERNADNNDDGDNKPVSPIKRT